MNVPGGGAGPAPGTAFNYRPLGTFWGYDRSQMQFSAAELTAAGVPNGIIISRVAFFLTSFSSPTPNTPVRVLLKEVGGAPGLVPSTYAAASAPATLCFNGTVSSATFLPNTWVTIILTSPFYFNGGGTHLEVIVETNFGGGGGEAFNGKIFSRSTAPGNLYQYWSADNTPPIGNGFVSASRPDAQLTYTVATPCAGVPAGVTAVASASSVCANVPYTISLSNLYPPYNSGYTFQWVSSTTGAGGPFTPIAGATQAIYASAGQIATTWYQCQIQCSGGPVSTSSVVQVSMSSPTGCYCNSNAISSVDTDIGQVVFGALTNPAAPGPTTNNPTAFNIYTNFTASVPVQNYTQGTNYPITLRQITSGTFFFAAYFNVFIDYNQDGFFDPTTERVFSGGPTGPTSANPVTTSVSGSITIPYSSLTGNTRMRVVLREGGNNTNPPCGTYTWGETEDYTINIVPGPPCGLTNAGTTTTTLSNVCPLQVFTLNLSGTTTLGSGMTWQWQSGPAAGGPWTNIAGATYYPFATTQSVTTWYRCRITCGATTLFSAPVQVIQNTATQCYCIPVHIPNCNNMWTANVTFNTLNNTTGCTSNTGLAYNVYPASGSTTTTVTQNQTYNISVQTMGVVNAIISVWIDYNFNGIYEPTEWQQLAVSNPPGTIAQIPITIPGTSGTGLTGMRVRSRFSGNPNNASSACITFGSGETEDYFITINPFIPPACVGVPGPFTAFTSATSACSGSLINLTLNPNASTVFSGLTYQWQNGPSAAGPWTNVAGATGKTYSFNIIASEWYRCVITCTNSGLSANSTPVSIVVQPATWLGFTDDWNDPTNWCGRVPTLVDDAQVNFVLSGRPAALYYFPVVAVGDTMRARNLAIASTDSVTVLTDTTVSMSIAQNLNNNGKMAIVSTKADTLTFGNSSTNSGLIQIFRGGTTPDNIVQVIYTVSELQAAGMLPDDIIDSIYFKFYLRGSTAAYQNFNISYAQLPAGQDQFVTNDPLLGVTTVYSNPALIIGTPINGVYTALSASTGVLKLPLNNMRWDGVSNILVQVCYDMTAGTPGGSDFMYLSSTAPRKSCLWLGSTTIGTSGCALTSLSPGLISNFGQVPSTLRPNIGFRFRRAQVLVNGSIGGDLNNNAGAKFWSSFANLSITGNINNASQVFADTSVITLNGLFNNNGSTDFSYTPLFSNRKTIMNFLGTGWNNNGVFLAGNSLVSFNGNAAQSIGGVNPSTFHELKINKGALTQTVTLLLNTQVEDTLTLSNGLLLLNSNSITVNNNLPAGGTLAAPLGPISRSAGFIISESAASAVKWNVGTVSGFRVIPFGSNALSPVYIPFSFTHNTGDLGVFSMATYNTPANNLPLPPTVAHLNIFSSATSNSAATVDRFWVSEKTGANPSTTLTFRFTTAERSGLISAINPGRAQPWRTANAGTYGAWLRITNAAGVPVGSTLGTPLSYSQNYYPAAGADSVRLSNWDWPVLNAGGAPFWSPAGPVGNFLPWAISNNNSPLPVELISFNAKAKGNSVYLDWSTASEINSDYFTVERTLDFNEHTEIAKVTAAGNSSQMNLYDAWDHQPADGINYYRLLQTDLDGTLHIASDYVPVRFGKAMRFEILHLLHDPSSVLVFDYNSDEPLQLNLYDLAGRLILGQQGIGAQPGLNMLPLDLDQLASGVYTIQLRNSVGASSHRFMKQ
ncbi:MAG: T9SS type A sorting domain-containing protein [Bacteroidia bacterium]|nr:T9SS type A sorting domain-containing protein [Bacteroidia bacterium]